MPYLSCKKIKNDVYNFPTWQYCKYKDIFDSRIIINSTAKFYISISYQKDLLSIDTRIFTPSNTKKSIFALFCLQLFISSRTHVKPRMRFSQSIYISLRLHLRKETKYSNYFSKNMNVFLLDNNRIHGIVFRLKTNMTILVIKCFYRRRIIN